MKKEILEIIQKEENMDVDMNQYKIKMEKEKVLRVEEIVLKKDFTTSVLQWRYKKKINNFKERLQNRIVENITERDPDKNITYSIKENH